MQGHDCENCPPEIKDKCRIPQVEQFARKHRAELAKMLEDPYTKQILQHTIMDMAMGGPDALMNGFEYLLGIGYVLGRLHKEE